MPTTTATSRARYVMDRQASFFQQCAGMAFLMSASVKGGRAARPFPVCEYHRLTIQLGVMVAPSHVKRQAAQQSQTDHPAVT